MIRKWLTIGIILLFIETCIIPAIAQNTEKSQSISRGNWLYVGGSGPGNYTRIQDAIDVAVPGDIVYIFDDSSPYYENINISKGISLVGENRKTTVIDGQNTPRFELNGENITINNLTIQKGNLNVWGKNILLKNIIIPGDPDTAVYAISLYHCSHITIFDCLIQGSTYGIFAWMSKFLDVQRNNFIDNYYDGNFFGGFQFSRWSRNYWDDWDGFGPYVIHGQFGIYIKNWYNFDWHPAQEAYDI
jgi:parallel beta-helix repeat protein